MPGQRPSASRIRLFSLGPPGPAVSGGSLGRHPGSSSEDGLRWRPLASLSGAWGMGPLGMLYLGP